MWQDISEKNREQFNNFATHPLQSFEWGLFREKTGIRVVRKAFFEDKKIKTAFQMTVHKIPHTPFTIGYIPKCKMPIPEMIEELKRLGREEKCIFIQLEPNIVISRHSGETRSADARIPSQKERDSEQARMTELGLIHSAHPLFTQYTFLLDLKKSEEEILKNMHPKTRYNIKVAQKHNVIVKEDDSEKAFESYLRLTEETTTRQGFYAHTPSYHKKMWETLKSAKTNSNMLTAHLLVSYYNSIPLTTWVLFVFHDTLYYPYGASSNLHRETMASNLQMWEAIKFGKKLGLKNFDMWGALGESPNPKDPWFGFHRFKQGYGPDLVEFVGSYDLVISPVLYQIYKIADKLRGIYLSLKK